MKKFLMGSLLASSVLALTACKKDTVDNADFQADVIVIGAGGAGMAATIEAADKGANVILFEKMPIIGGNTTYATGGLNAALTKQQKAKCTAGDQNFCDSIETFVNDTMIGGGEINDRTLVTKLATESASAVEWLEGTLGADLGKVASMAGASKSRTHLPNDGSPVGPEIVRALNAGLTAATRKNKIELVLNANVLDITINGNGEITGVRVKIGKNEYTASGSAVIIAAGGFANNQDMIVKYDPSLKGFISTNHPGATGDGITIAEELGVNLKHMEHIQTHPTVNIESSEMITEGVRGDGAFIINKAGERFTNEGGTRAAVSAAILEQEGQFGWLVYSDIIRNKRAATHVKYENKGIVKQAASLELLAAEIGATATNFEVAAEEMRTCVTSNFADTKCRGRVSNNVAKETDAYADAQVWKAIKIAPATHHTMGGIHINEKAETLNEAGNVIKGLYAAGEVTGGIHGNNRLGGNALADIIVFGRTAGVNAAKFALEKGSHGIVKPEDTSDKDCTPKNIYKDGNYEVTGRSTYNNQDITLKVVVTGNVIYSIEVINSGGQTGSIFEPALETISKKFKCGTLADDLATVSGATGSSNGIIAALKQIPLK